MLISAIKARGVKVIVYEPAIADADFFASPVVNDLQAFKQQADLIIANRLTPDIEDVAAKVYTRNLFGGDS